MFIVAENHSNPSKYFLDWPTLIRGNTVTLVGTVILLLYLL